jgi:hypothetical protein
MSNLSSGASTHFGWVHSKDANPSSHAVMAPLLSSSLSQARSCPCSLMTTAFEGDRALQQSMSRDRCHDMEAN